MAAFPGDMRNSVTKLLRELQRMKLKTEPNIQGLCLGSPSAFLPLLHAALMHYSLPLANWLARNDFALSGKNDLRFLEALYKVLRDVFHYRPRLTREQFLSSGFAERKVQLTTDLLLLCQAKHRELSAHKARKTTLRLRSDVLGGTTSRVSSAWPQHNTHTDQVQDEGLRTPPLPSSHDQRSHTLSSPHLTLPSPELDLTPRPLNSGPPPPQRPLNSGPPPRQPLNSGPLPRLSHSPPPSDSSSSSSNTAHQSTVVVNHLTRHSNRTTAVTGSSTATHRRLQQQAENVQFQSSGVPQPATDRDSPISWHSLPPVEILGATAPTVHEEEEEESQRLPRESSVLALGELSSRVEQLTRLVETMSARSVLLETQVKLLEAQGIRTHSTPRQVVSRGVQTDPRPSQADQIDAGIQTVDSARSDCLRAHHEGRLRGAVAAAVTPSKHTAPVGGSFESPVASKWTCSLRDKLLLSSQHWSQEDGGSPSPLPSTPHTPEDTKRMIEQLRGRAKVTKDFLQLANHSVED